MKRTNLIIAAFAVTAAAVASSGSAFAYTQYSQNRDATNCRACHGDFRASPYVSKVDNQSWGDDLHDVHRNTMLNGDCNTCHQGSSRFPVRLDVSTGGTGLAAISCVGCHGRSQDATSGTAGSGAGLRQRHYRTGTTSCVNCHADSNPASKTAVGENLKPPYYASPGTNHPALPTDPCNPSPAFTENFKGTTLGLDNDGDLLFDQSDPNCGAAAVCGNGTVEPGEQCDDRNTVGGDCCSATCQYESAGSACSDGLFCNAGETCNGSGTCAGGSPKNCDDGDICTDDTCNEGADRCDHVFDPTNDPSCQTAACGNGRVESGEQCDDGNTVGGDCCSATCRYESAGSACSDGLFCTAGETCNGTGTCAGGTARNCDDGIACTTDTCDEATDRCVHARGDAACADGLFCNGVETCSATSGCRPGTPVGCDDGDICTDDACNEGADRCDHVFDRTNAPECQAACPDADADGYSPTATGCGSVDCDDSDATVFPGAAESCTDDKDNDCDGKIDAADETCGGNAGWSVRPGPRVDPAYAGSLACASCHSAQYDTWSRSLHARMLIRPGDAQAAGFPLPDNSSVPGVPVSIASWRDVLFVIGQKWSTLFVDQDGAVQKAQWNYQSGRWSQHPGGPYNCGSCHTTGYDAVSTFTDPDGRIVPGIAGAWVEYNIGCEACHGPAAEHAASPSKDNVNRIVLNWAATGEGVQTPAIRSAAVCGNCHFRNDHSAGLDSQRRSRSQYNDWSASPHASSLESTTLNTYCAKCHSPGNATAESEEHYFTYFDPKTATQVACASCHDPHRVSGDRWSILEFPAGGQRDPKDNPAAIARYRGTDGNPGTTDYTPFASGNTNALCTDCHQQQPGFRRHVDASPPVVVRLYPPGNSQPFDVPHLEHVEEGRAECVDCHMPRTRTSTNINDIRTHTLRPNEWPLDGAVHYSDTCGQCHDEARNCDWCHQDNASGSRPPREADKRSRPKNQRSHRLGGSGPTK